MKPTFDAWTILFLVTGMQGVFLSILLFMRKSGANRLLGGLILSYSLCLLFYVLFWTRYYLDLPREIGALQGLTFLFGPLTYFYLRSDRKKVFWNAFHLVPFALYLVAYFIGSRSAGLRSIGPILAISQIVHLITYYLLIQFWLKKNKTFGNPAQKRLSWQQKVSWAFAGYCLSFLLYYILVWTGLLRIEYDYMISLASSFFIYFIGYHGFQNQGVLLMNEPTRYENSALSRSTSEILAKKLKELMETERIYLRSSLKLQDVADRMGVQSHHISQIINELEEKNFSEYVNSYRIREAKKLLSDTDHKIIHVAFDTGFNNKASFNYEFKKQTGISPSEYRSRQSHEA